MELLTVLRRHRVEAFIQVVFTGVVQAVAARLAAHAVAHGEVGDKHEKI